MGPLLSDFHELILLAWPYDCEQADGPTHSILRYAFCVEFYPAHGQIEQVDAATVLTPPSPPRREGSARGASDELTTSRRSIANRTGRQLIRVAEFDGPAGKERRKGKGARLGEGFVDILQRASAGIAATAIEASLAQLFNTAVYQHGSSSTDLDFVLEQASVTRECCSNSVVPGPSAVGAREMDGRTALCRFLLERQVCSL
ncbi:hypothetical protein BIW11_12792 [Tropilaelaps mercedesae]|uniref:Uncharacterized protein n=1 Tax=Tropilaelaps mercedesae TaxID=418985 RepID=A0A1V9X5G1_9ACAR|nr:hypothetical protein BIW11_12792 [Tropilaelaps mercedesae]